MSKGRRGMSRLKQRVHFPSLPLFVLFSLSVDLMMPTHKCEGIFFTQFIGSWLISSRITLTDTLRNKALPGIWVSFAQSRRHSKITIKPMWSRSGWVVQLVKHLSLDFGSGHDLRVLRSSPALGSRSRHGPA